MDLPRPHLPGLRITRGTLKDTYLGNPKNMHIPSAQDMAYFIKKAGKQAFLYCCDIACAYPQFPLNPVD